MRRVKSHSVHAGDMFSVVAPSSCLERKLLRQGETKVEGLDYYLTYTPRVFQRQRYMAGADQDRVRDLVEALRNPNSQAIWCARGGVGATRMLPLMDAARVGKLLERSRKLIIGYSDITAIHSYAWQTAGLTALHAPLMATPSWLNMKRPAVKDFFALIAGEAALGRHSYSTKWPTRFLSAKRSAEGIVRGGNLSVLCAMVGTPWQPNFRNSILFIEDVAEAPYRIDKMLTQMTQAGCFRGIRGLIIGDLEHDVPKAYLRKTHWREVIHDHFDGYKIPILQGLPVGHAPRNEALPFGVKMRITRSGKLELLEQVVR